MKKILPLLLVILLSNCWLMSMAQGPSGAEWSYSSTSTKGVFHVRFSLFIRCSNPAPCTDSCNNFNCYLPVSLSSADSSNRYFTSASLQLTSVDELRYGYCDTVTTVCTNRGCKSVGWFTLGYERYTFEGDVDLNTSLVSGISDTDCFIRLSYLQDSLLRSGEINTGMAGEAFYTELIINRCYADNNTSPKFNNEPKMLACGAQPFVYNNNAMDAEFDSLSYRFAPALTGPGQSASYTSPYSYIYPLTWSGPANGTFPMGIKCEATTGDIMFTALNGGAGTFVGVVVIEVQEWKKINGIYRLVSIIRRENDVFIIACRPNNSPTLSTNPTKTNYEPQVKWEVNAGSTLCFDIIAKDTDFRPPGLSDTTYLSFQHNLPGATFTPNYIPAQRGITGPREDTYKFCWTPDDSLGRKNLPYYFYATAKDSRCPFPANIIRTFSVLVYNAKAKASIIKEKHGCREWKMRYEKHDSSQVFKSTIWSITKEPNDYTFSHGAYNYPNVKSTPVITFTKPGKYLVELRVTLTGATGTVNTSVIRDTLDLDSMIFANAPNDTILCSTSDTAFVFIPEYNPSDAQVTWYILPDTNTAISDSAQLVINKFSGSRSYLFKVNSSEQGCIAYDSFTISMEEPVAQFMLSRDSVCQNDSIVFHNTSTGATSYKWDMGDGTLYYEESPSHKYQVPGQYTIHLVAGLAFNCKDSTDKTISVAPSPSAPTISGDTTAIKYTTKIYRVPYTANSSWRWFIKGDITHTSMDDSVSVVWDYLVEGGLVQVIEWNHYGCASDTASLSVHLAPPVGLAEINSLNAIQWYPVPAKDVLYFSAPHIKIDHISLYNLEGRELVGFSEKEISDKALSLASISTGLYLLRLESNGSFVTKKISIIK